MSFMFNDCISLKEINFIQFENDKVTDTTEIFQGWNKLEYLDLSNFNTSNTNYMGGKFNYCHKLKQIKWINNFNIIKVINMIVLFQECNELEYLNFYTSNINDMGRMFNECHKLKYLNIKNFNIKIWCNTELMFINLNSNLN